MSRLASFLTVLWLSSATADTGFVSTLTQEQSGFDPVGKILTFIGDAVCNHVKPLAGVAYGNYDKEPDMSKLTLVHMTRTKTVFYNLTDAAEEFPKERWFNSKLPLRIYLHGFIENPTRKGFQTMKNAFFAQEASKDHANILALDASSLIKFFYLRASTMVRFIGEILGRTLAVLVSAGMDPQNIHLIGHSLGSHIAGFAGQTFFSLKGFHVGRISGLDPAGPCFGKLDPELRLSKEDADFVFVIHTDAGVYGIDQQIGHVDFWPNGGATQPNCWLQVCSHSRAWRIYAQSVLTPEAFIAVKCNSYSEFKRGLCDYNDTSIMGYGTPATTRGMYFCQTLGEEPYGIGDKGLRYNESARINLGDLTDTLING